MNKDYLKIFLVPLIVILCMLLKPLYIYTFGEEIVLKCTIDDNYNSYSNNIYPDFKIEDKAKNTNIFDESIIKHFDDNITKIDENIEDHIYDLSIKEAYAILEKKDDYHDIKYITLNKPNNNELYLKCSLGISPKYEEDYSSNNTNNINDYNFDIYVDFDLIEYKINYKKDDICFTNDGEQCIKFMIKNSSIFKKII